MKVICVKDIKSVTKYKNVPCPEVGDEDEVTGIAYHPTTGCAFFFLLGYSDQYAFSCDHFATLPDTTADEMQEAEQEAILM